MIWTWLRIALLWMVKLVVPPPELPKPLGRINPNSPCPTCGNGDGRLRGVTTNDGIMVQHQCQICMSVWYEKPVVKLERDSVYGANVEFFNGMPIQKHIPKQVPHA